MEPVERWKTCLAQMDYCWFFIEARIGVSIAGLNS
jgi:hypothetical protein